LQHVAGDDPFCKYNDQLLQLFTSCLFLSGAAAALVGSYTCRRFGRKATMMTGGACFLAGTVLVTLAIHMSMLVLGRLVLGVGVGFAAQVGAGSTASLPQPTIACVFQLYLACSACFTVISCCCWLPDSRIFIR
jgi:MFS family permease